MAMTYYETRVISDHFGNNYLILDPRAEFMEVFNQNNNNTSTNDEKTQEESISTLNNTTFLGNTQENLIPVNYELKELNVSPNTAQQDLISTVYEKQINVNCSNNEEEQIAIPDQNGEQINTSGEQINASDEQINAIGEQINASVEQNNLFHNDNTEQSNLFPVYNDESILSDDNNEEQQNLDPLDFEGQLDFSPADNGNYLESLDISKDMIDSECSCTCNTDPFNRKEKMDNVILLLDKKLRSLPPCMKPQAYSDILLYLRYLRRQHHRMVLRGVEKTIPGY